jgi:tetratricopeptide (TPR) repeat protein/predicted Ser/Thr protein kinase
VTQSEPPRLDSGAATDGASETLAADGMDHTRDPAEPEPVARHLREGARLGRYVVLERLGAGGMGVVLAAYDPELDRRVAVKVLRPRGRGEASVARARLQREARALARLEHPNVVAVHDVGDVDGSVFVAMEYVAGRTLGAWLAGGRSVAEVLDVFLAAGRGLAAAHAAGLVHRDFKPDNVMVGHDGRVRVMDFGLARGERDQPAPPDAASAASAASGVMPGDVTLTAAGALVGTPAYMAPEQFSGGATDPRTDQFAFCVALWEALFAARPFAGETLAEIVASVSRGERRPMPTTPALPTELRRAIERGLSTRADERWPDMPSLLAALRPSPRRRRGRLAAAGLAGLVLAAGAWGVSTRIVDDPCAGLEGELAGAWDPGLREEVEAAVGAPVAETLDGYAVAWLDVRTRTCRAAWSSPDSEVADRSLACLHERRLSLRTLGGALRDGSAELRARAPELAAELPLLGPCEDASYLLARVRPPEDPETATRVGTVRERLEQVRRLEWEARYDEALVALDDLAAAARPLEYAPLTAEIAHREGVVEDYASRWTTAEQRLEDCFFHGQAAGHHEVAADCAAKLVHVTGDHLGRPVDARRWGRHAQVAIDQGALDDRRRAALANNLGNLDLGAGDPKAALARYEQALDGWRRSMGPEHADVATALGNIGRTKVRLGDVAAGLDALNQALAIREAALGPAHPHVGGTWHEIGLAERAAGRPAEAIAALERAVQVRRSALGPTHPQVADSLAVLGRTLLDAGQPGPAAEALRTALPIVASAAGPEHADPDELERLLGRAEAALAARGVPAQP